jgi:hypothetical protein
MLLHDKLPTFHFRLSLFLSLRSKVKGKMSVAGFTAMNEIGVLPSNVQYTILQSNLITQLLSGRL